MRKPKEKWLVTLNKVERAINKETISTPKSIIKKIAEDEGSIDLASDIKKVSKII